jgi:hypothetical protein
MLIKFNQYPENYEEEKMPQVIIEIRYRKGEKAEADLLAQKRMMILTAEDIVEITNRMNNEFQGKNKPSQGYLEYLMCKVIRNYKNIDFFKEELIKGPDKDGYNIEKCLHLDKKTFKLYWLDDTTEIVKGRTFTKAMTHAGYGKGAVRALDYYKEIYRKGETNEKN